MAYAFRCIDITAPAASFQHHGLPLGCQAFTCLLVRIRAHHLHGFPFTGQDKVGPGYERLHDIHDARLVIHEIRVKTYPAFGRYCLQQPEHCLSPDPVGRYAEHLPAEVYPPCLLHGLKTDVTFIKIRKCSVLHYIQVLPFPILPVSYKNNCRGCSFHPPYI